MTASWTTLGLVNEPAAERGRPDYDPAPCA
jgi:hypothetical protein